MIRLVVILVLIFTTRSTDAADAPTASLTKIGELNAIGPSFSVRFSPSNTLIYTYVDAAGSTARKDSLCVWDAKSLTRLFAFPPSEGRPTFSRDDQVVLTYDGNSWAFLRDARSGKLLQRLRHIDFEPAPALSPDGAYVLTLSDAVCLWEAKSGKLLKKLGPASEEFDHLEFGRDGKAFLAVEYPNMHERIYHVMDIASGKDRFTPIHPDWEQFLTASRRVQPVGWTPDGRRLVVFGLSSFHVHDANTGALVSETNFGNIGDPMCLTFTADSRRMLITGSQGAELFDVETAKPKSREFRYIPLFASFANDNSSGLSPDGRLLACAGLTREPGDKPSRQIACIWDLATGQRIIDFDDANISAFAFNSDGTRLVAQHMDRHATIWSVKYGR